VVKGLVMVKGLVTVTDLVTVMGLVMVQHRQPGEVRLPTPTQAKQLRFSFSTQQPPYRILSVCG